MEISAEMLRMLLPELYHAVFAAFAHISKNAATALLTATWQGLAVALFLMLCLRFAPRVSAGSRFTILAGGFTTVVLLPFVPALILRAAHPAGVGGDSLGPIPAHPWLVLDARWSMALTLLWLAASLWRGLDLGVHTLRLRQLWKNAQPVTAVDLPEVPKLWGRRAIEICATEELERPSVIGFLAPRILIPSWLLQRMSQAELEQIVLHETEHLRRGDDWTNLLQKLSLVAFPLNPVLIWMERRLCLEREMACDEGVVRRTRAPRAYAACLTNLAEHGLERHVQALTLGAWQRRPELVWRVHSLLTKKPVLKPAAAGSMIAVLGCGVLAGSVELARCPQVIGFAAAPVITQHVEAPSNVATTALKGDQVLQPESRSEISRIAPSSNPQPHVTRLRAELPNRNQPLRRELPYITSRSVMREEEVVKSNFPALPVPQEGFLNADAEVARNAYSQPGVEEEQTQGWVVMTAMWEQVETASTPTISDTTTAEAENMDAAQQPARHASQITITKLVFEVTPSNTDSKSRNLGTKDSGLPINTKIPPSQSMPAFVPVRDGWLIFQL